MHGRDGVQIHVHLLLENLIFPPSTWMQCVGTREGGRAGGQHHLVTKLAAQEKHSTESTKAVCVGPLSVLGAAESRFSCWRIHCLECCVYFAVVLPLDAEWAQQVHKSRVTGWEHSPEKARGLFIVQSPGLKRRCGRSLIISGGIAEKTGWWRQRARQGSGLHTNYSDFQTLNMHGP